MTSFKCLQSYCKSIVFLILLTYGALSCASLYAEDQDFDREAYRRDVERRSKEALIEDLINSRNSFYEMERNHRRFIEHAEKHVEKLEEEVRKHHNYWARARRLEHLFSEAQAELKKLGYEGELLNDPFAEIEDQDQDQGEGDADSGEQAKGNEGNEGSEDKVRANEGGDIE